MGGGQVEGDIVSGALVWERGRMLIVRSAIDTARGEVVETRKAAHE